MVPPIPGARGPLRLVLSSRNPPSPPPPPPPCVRSPPRPVRLNAACRRRADRDRTTVLQTQTPSAGPSRRSRSSHRRSAQQSARQTDRPTDRRAQTTRRRIVNCSRRRSSRHETGTTAEAGRAVRIAYSYYFRLRVPYTGTPTTMRSAVVALLAVATFAAVHVVQVTGAKYNVWVSIFVFV